ncbi:MAG: LUD domain-containing protein, partial [Mycolicibacterium sp.]|nr:LUD domain-containing protein [Mycolicibacterium sp.]
ETDPVGVAEAVATALDASGVRRLIAPDGLCPEWLGAARDAGIETIPDTGPRSAADLDGIDAVVTAAAVGIASTGTIVLDHGPDQGRRALTLVPDLHVCVIRDDQLLADVPEAVARLQTSVTDGRPLTWISGPSATSDIELDRVEGVHGPRKLHIVLVRTS